MFEWHIKPSLLWASAGIILLLILGTVIIAFLSHQNPEKDFSELRARLRSWWWMAGIFILAMLIDPVISLVLFGFLSFLALKEYLSLIPTRRADRRVLFWAYLAIPVQYYWIGIAWYGVFIIFIPIYMFLLLPIRMILIGETEGFLRAAGTLHWGLMTTVFCLSHAAYFLALPEEGNPIAGGAGLLLFLVFLTEFNDVSQYVWGKLLGKHKIIPKVSPNKTWEGFLGGLVTTTLLAALVAPLLTPLILWQSVFAGVLIASAGFFGDVSISALKRDLAIKDSGNLLPGHGGILDRVDSLTYTAPLFFHFVYYLHY
ncbi:MAG: phosphatidate cytidylyltransferase [Candidatus Parabeggiatoa sp. nov. 3]|nr:MAG: phosphatidate cytidylyltransferase [Gammaproteobacteria bacterium]RKZ56864.1 MAG: phosphatidate cytidylyltransferase [Gammaproteobacteria bacterium]RKZ79404.1 MAG: phosphatidate cytidylyltransferase [Gammaproteobacteria bacterium]